MIRIKNIAGKTLYTSFSAGTIKDAVREAASKKVDLSGAKLVDVDLFGVDMRNMKLSGADLSASNLIRADLSGSDLRGAKLNYTNFMDANLSGADLTGADLQKATLLSAANLSGAKGVSIRERRKNLIRKIIREELLREDAALAKMKAHSLIQDFEENILAITERAKWEGEDFLKQLRQSIVSQLSATLKKVAQIRS